MPRFWKRFGRREFRLELTRAVASIVFAGPLLLPLMPLSAASDHSGTVEICRRPGIVSSLNGKPIMIPAGATFQGFAVDGRAAPIQVEITEAAIIGAHDKCIHARAKDIGDQAHTRVRVTDRRTMGPSGPLSGDGAPDPNALPGPVDTSKRHHLPWETADLVARAVAGFN
jgi:hypothetical protein